MTAPIARAREGRKPRVRSAEYKAGKAERAKERRRMSAFARDQVTKTKAAREAQALVIQPSASKRQRMQSANVPGETVEQFLARGGCVDVLPGLASKPGPTPARYYIGTGARGA